MSRKMGKDKKMSLFDDGDEEDVTQNGKQMSINKNYANRYENWRRLEEMQKIKDRFGNDADSDDSSSSEEPAEWTNNDEEAFLKTLGALKGNDDSIYNTDKRFFNQAEADINGTKTSKEQNNKKKEMTLRDYERKLVLEKGGKLDESDDDEPQKHGRGYYEEQEELRKSLRQAIHGDNDEGDILVKRQKTDQEKELDEEDFSNWMKTADVKEDARKAKELRSLKKAWNDKNIDEDEKFLRDYILNKDFEPGEDEALPTYDEIVALAEDEKEMDKQRSYEQKYNFRFEDPDQDFIKKYPRTVAESLRTETSKRKEKRQERLQRKKSEKEEKMKELDQLKKMKRAEIERKLEKLNKAAGCEITLSLDDLQADFDPKEFDKKMEKIFNDEYYGQTEELPEDEDEKPVFSDMDDSDIEDYDKLDVQQLKKEAKVEDGGEDSEEDGQEDGEKSEAVKNKKSSNPIEAAAKAMQRDKNESRRKRKRNALKEALSREKPAFDPKEKTFEEYFNEYYALDYEDIIDDQATKFKYREVAPNNYGLSAEEILNADDRQLNAWASLRKITAYRTDQEEKFDVMAYKRKAQNVQKKSKIFNTDFGGKKSLKRAAEDMEGQVEEEEDVEATSTKKKKRRVKKKKVVNEKSQENEEEAQEEAETVENGAEDDKVVEEKSEEPKKEGKKKKKWRGNKKQITKDNALEEKYGKGVTEARVKAYGLNAKRLKRSLVYGDKEWANTKKEHNKKTKKVQKSS